MMDVREEVLLSKAFCGLRVYIPLLSFWPRVDWNDRSQLDGRLFKPFLPSLDPLIFSLPLAITSRVLNVPWNPVRPVCSS